RHWEERNRELVRERDESDGEAALRRTERDAAIARAAMSEAAEAALRGALLSVEWADDQEEGSRCPSCKSWGGDGPYRQHGPACRIAAALSSTAGAAVVARIAELEVDVANRVLWEAYAREEVRATREQLDCLKLAPLVR